MQTIDDAKRIFLVCSAFATINTNGNGICGFEPFVETFDGNGQFEASEGKVSGLDNGGWSFDGDGQLKDGGYSFANVAVLEFDRLGRDVAENGSFVARIEIRELELPPGFQGANGSIEFDFFLDPSGLRHRLMAGLYPETDLLGADPSKWFFGVYGGGDAAAIAEVPIGRDVSLEIVFDKETSQSVFTYDWDTHDDDPGITLGPLAYTESFASVNYNRVSLWAESGGIVDHWSVHNTMLGDFDSDGALDVDDVNLLISEIQSGTNMPRFDLNNDSAADDSDLREWVQSIANTWFGDANLDSEFNSNDLVAVFQAGQYEDDDEQNSTWSTGDWNGDAEFNSRDLVLAFEDAGYESGRRSLRAVPEPRGVILPALLVLGGMSFWRHSND